MFKVGDKVRDIGRYRDSGECDGIVVCTTRCFYVIGEDYSKPYEKPVWKNHNIHWVKQRAAFDLVVKFRDGTVEFYNPHGSTMIDSRESILVKL